MMVRVRVDVILMLNVCLLQNLQSINRQTMRFKPPPINSKIGWRVEFRPIEVSSEWSASISVLNMIPEKCSVYMFRPKIIRLRWMRFYCSVFILIISM